MPRPGPRRPHVAVRLEPDLLAWFDATAAALGVTRSELIRNYLHTQATENGYTSKETR